MFLMFLNYLNIVCILFWVKSTLKNNHNHTLKHPLKRMPSYWNHNRLQKTLTLFLFWICLTGAVWALNKLNQAYTFPPYYFSSEKNLLFLFQFSWAFRNRVLPSSNYVFWILLMRWFKKKYTLKSNHNHTFK
jgi:hypothetical protein